MMVSASLSFNSLASAQTKKSKAKAKTAATSEKSAPAKASPAKKSPPPKKISPREELLHMDDMKDSAPMGEPSAHEAMSTAPAAPAEAVDLGYYYWQASPGRFAITPYGEAGYFVNKGTIVSGAPGGFPYDIKGQKYRIGIEVEYGIFRYLSLGLGASYFAQYTDEDVSTSNGFEDVPVFAKAILPLKNFTLHYGIRMTFSPSDKINDGMGNRNAFSGGNAYAPYFGISRRLQSGVAGVDFSYAYKDTRSSTRDVYGNQQNFRTNTEGGHVLMINGFYERRMAAFTFGAAVGYAGESQKTYKTNTSTSFEDGESNFVGRIYFPFKMSGMDVIPSVWGQTFLDDQLGNRLLDAKWQITARCDVRF